MGSLRIGLESIKGQPILLADRPKERFGQLLGVAAEPQVYIILFFEVYLMKKMTK